MLPFLLNNWKWLGSAAIATLLTGSLAWKLHTWDVEDLNAEHKAAMAAREVELARQCTAAQNVTKEVADALQEKLTSAEQQLAAAKRVRPNACTPVHPGRAAVGRNAGANNAQLHIPHGVYSDDLLDFAYDAEVVGSRLDACQDFLRREYPAPAAKTDEPRWWEVWK